MSWRAYQWCLSGKMAAQYSQSQRRSQIQIQRYGLRPLNVTVSQPVVLHVQQVHVRSQLSTTPWRKESHHYSSMLETLLR